MSTPMYAIEYKNFGGSRVGSTEAYSIERRLTVCFEILGVDQMDRAILYTLALGGGWSLRSLSGYLEVPRSTLRRRVQRLALAEVIDSTGEGLRVDFDAYSKISREISEVVGLAVIGEGTIYPESLIAIRKISVNKDSDLSPFEVPR